MALPRTLGLTALIATLIGLSSCGGGGGHDGVVPSTFPTSGAYGWILKPFTSLPTLSFVHPSQPDTEYAVTVLGADTSDLVRYRRQISSGTVNASTRQVTALQPSTLVFIAGESVRSLSLQADGTAPTWRPPVSGSAGACGFLMVANDYAHPLKSRILVLGKSAANDCSESLPDSEGPGSLGNSELRFSASGELITTHSGTSRQTPVGVLRDTATLAPRAWLYADSIVLWNNGSGTTVPLSPAGTTDTHIVVASTDRSAIVRRHGGLSVLDFPGGTTIHETALSPVLTAGNNWELIGFDADALYLSNEASAGAPDFLSWTVLKVTRSSPVASVLATGTGYFVPEGIGRNLLYVSVQDTGTDQPARLIRINKSGGIAGQTVLPVGVQTSLQTTPAGVHMLQFTQVEHSEVPGGQVVRTALRIVDENDTTLYTADHGQLFVSYEGDAVNFDSSENHTRFVFASSNSPNLANAMLIGYDTTTRTATTFGTLPSNADGETDIGIELPGPSNFVVGLVGKASFMQAIDPKLFSFDLDTPNSLKYTTVVK
ncbi:MAG: hypothetical protein QFE16_09785 [Pseudomonadota bacterium]|nr:hypothetical protein [Pseudomonadota bacterium]